MADDVSFICFRSGRCNLEGAVKALAQLALQVQRRGDELEVSYSGGPVLRVFYSEDEHVAEESADMADGHAGATALLPCNARFEVVVDDLDHTLEDYNTLFAVQEALVGATGGFLFNSWNGNTFLWSE